MYVLSKIAGFFVVSVQSPYARRAGRGVAVLHPLRSWWQQHDDHRPSCCSRIAGLSPLGNVLIFPLEQRFPAWDASRGAPDGIVVLGGAVTADIAAARHDVALNERPSG